MRHALFSFVVSALAVQQVVSHPLDRRATIDDDVILNYALTLEHLENAFYTGALAQFNDQAFEDAGLPPWARRRFEEVAAHEATHVQALSSALGDKATQPCTYSFPYQDVKSFVALSQVLEGVGASAYTGAAQFITTPAYFTVAASILSTEARHASWVASAINKFAAWGSAFEIPLSLNEVFTLAVGFITSCPSTNPTLPVTPFPGLILNSAVPGQSASVRYASTAGKATHVAFYFGLSKIFVPIDYEGKVAVPAELSGQVYAVATTSGTEATDNTIVAGPAILSFERDSTGQLINN